MIDCDHVKKLGLTCFQVKPNVIAINTPISFSDGEPITLFLENMPSNKIKISDNADILFHLVNTNLGLEDRRRWRSLHEIASNHEAVLTEKGEIYKLTNEDSLSVSFGIFLRLAAAIVEWEENKSLLPVEEDDLVEGIESVIRRRNPTSVISRSPRISGSSGKTHNFGLKVDAFLIEPIKPNTRSTGATLRKVLDVEKAGEFSILIVMDDRHDLDSARVESSILSTVVRVARYSKIASGEGPIDFGHVGNDGNSLH